MSKHLRVLREVGAVDVRHDGRRRLYRLNGHALKPIHDWVKAYERTWSERFEQLDAVLEDLKGEEEDDDGKSGSGAATVTLPTDDQILITREFAAPGTWSTGRGRPRSWSAAGGTPSAAR